MDSVAASQILAQNVHSPLDSMGMDIALDCGALNAPLLFVDTAGCGLVEVNEELHGGSGGGGGKDRGKAVGGGSKANLGEADIVVKHVLALIETLGLHPGDIGVVSPYSAQTNLLKALLHSRYPTLTVSTVDGFQGCEK